MDESFGYVMKFPQIDPNSLQAKGLHIPFHSLYLNEDWKFSKKVFDRAAELAKTAIDVYELYNKIRHDMAEGI